MQVRYILDDKYDLTTFLEDDAKSNGFSSKELPWLPDIVKDFVLPAGFPGNDQPFFPLPFSFFLLSVSFEVLLYRIQNELVY